MKVSSFLSNKEGVMKLKEYELNVKNLDSSSGKLIKCLCVLKLGPNMKGQSVKQELKKHDFIKALNQQYITRMFSRYFNWIGYILGLCHWRNKT